MLLRTFVTLLLVTAFQNGEFSNMASGPEQCMELIQEGGDIACNLTGQGKYRGMSVGNCWVSCTDNFVDFFLPHSECERVLQLESWAGFQVAFGSLPPYNFENCDVSDVEKLEEWVDKWNEHKETSEMYLCSTKKNDL
uniref:Putative salivary secreted protein n=1 Tax=Ixodes ricinus TaxID=34613 RepID=A0A147BQG0_IXORI